MNRDRPYDAVLLIAFGGPEGPDQIRPFLENVVRGKPVPPNRVEEVVVHPPVGENASVLDRRWASLLEQLMAVHPDTRLAMRIAPPTGLR